jgi:O-antigen/teichoic acid export membrane protein
MNFNRLGKLLRAGLCRASTLRREVGWVTLGQIVAALGSLLSVRIMTGLLNPSSYGEVALGMTAAMLVNQLLFGPLTNGVVRFYAPASEAGDLGNYLHAVRRLTFFVTLAVVAIGVLVGIPILVFLRSTWLALVFSVLVYAALLGYNGLLSGIQNAARQRSIVALHQGLEAWTRVLFAGVLVLLWQPTSSAAVHGYTLGIIVVLFSQYFFFGRIRKNATVARPGTDWNMSILRYSWPFCTWSLFTWAQLSADRWALGLFSGTTAVGLYAALFQLGNYPISVAMAMALQLFAPIIYQRAGDGSDKTRTTQARTLCMCFSLSVLALTVAASAVCALYHRSIFHLFVASKYFSVSSMLPWLMLASGVFAASQAMELNLLSQMQTKRLIGAKIYTAIGGVALSFAGAYWYGVRGVVFSGLAFSVAYFAWIMVMSRGE